VTFAWVLAGSAVLFGLYTYGLYPLIVQVLGGRPGTRQAADPPQWPRISITVPAYNEAAQIRETVESLLRIDYPRDRMQILIVSDASTDGTDEIVAQYADRGIDLLRMPTRTGKTAAENEARKRLTGTIIINTDASIRIYPDAVKALIREFADPTVGVASGRDVSTAHGTDDANVGESGYVGYEMWVRDLETRAGGIVGASGCLYAIRRELHETVLPAALSRDFASALVARENGYCAVSVPGALCLVPRALSIHTEYRRKVRTMIRGMGTLRYKKHLMNPLRYGRFGWMLFSHKVCRWLTPWLGVAGLIGVLLLPIAWPVRAAVAAVAIAAAVLAWIGWRWPEHHQMPRIVSIPAYAVMGNVAAMVAAVRVLGGRADPVWEPTRRGEPPSVATVAGGSR
jgi:cellulose synthase/poly-beta-1,6-N-acetylglucosamine synthase-like glycosyltransferase